MFTYQAAISLILFLLLVNFILNNFYFTNINSFKLPVPMLKSPPLISVLIPARNEEGNIGRCLNSLRKQDYTNLEILVLDDRSRDATAQEVEKASRLDSRIKLISGKTLPPRWMGKSYACWQLARHAKGKYLLFTDADTLHFKKSVSSSLAVLARERMDAISVFPSQVMVTFHERMVVSFINFAFLCFPPLLMMKKTRYPLFSAGTGQFILFRRETYDAIGGHRSVREKVIEDVAIAKQVKRKGLKFMIYDGRQQIYCRMYKNLHEVIRGFSKFIFAAFDFNLALMFLVMSLVTILFLLPFICFPLAVVFGWPAVTVKQFEIF
ncbi:MAG: glycosyltransferase [Actinomycetota bacterium]